MPGDIPKRQKTFNKKHRYTEQNKLTLPVKNKKVKTLLEIVVLSTMFFKAVL